MKRSDKPLSDAARRRFLLQAGTTAGSLFLTGCDKLSQSQWFPKVLDSAATLNQHVQQALGSSTALAPEYSKADISPVFRANGTTNPNNAVYQKLAANGFQDWQLTVDGLVQQPLHLSLSALQAMPARTQITRHDCVEGWSVIGQWTGVPLRQILAMAQPKPQARYVVFHCADPMDGDSDPYYESLNLSQAVQPQTILAYRLNDQPLPIANGAPLRLRVPLQLGYKMAKYLMRVELVESFAPLRGGNGGYWEDQGYAWYAGI